MGSLPGRGRHLLLPETDLLTPPPQGLPPVEQSVVMQLCPNTTSNHRKFSGSCNVYTCGPGASPLAVSGRHEGCRQSFVPQGPCVPDRPLRQRSREHGPAVLGCTGAD